MTDNVWNGISVIYDNIASNYSPVRRRGTFPPTLLPTCHSVASQLCLCMCVRARIFACLCLPFNITVPSFVREYTYVWEITSVCQYRLAYVCVCTLLCLYVYVYVRVRIDTLIALLRKPVCANDLNWLN